MKATINGYERKGFLNSPPEVLLKALSSIQALHEQEDSKVVDFVAKMLEKYPKMARQNRQSPGYVYQGVEKDRLFSSTYIHVDDEKDCIGCNRSEEVDREDRNSTMPVIHYGIIASGNTVVEDAPRRDEIAKIVGPNCLCLEMEAAGLMNHFPCLIIRGICDYADSHKTDKWQRYAAAVAAAYGKELLDHVPTRDLQKTKTIEHALLDIQKRIAEVSDEQIKQHERTQKAVDELHVYHQNEGKDKHRQLVLDWLSLVSHADRHFDFRSRRQAGTGTWFLKSKEYKAWLETDKHTLLGTGIPGAGKSFLASIVIDDLQQQFLDKDSTAVVYLYLSKQQDDENVVHLYSSMIKQLAIKNESVFTILNELYKQHEEGRSKPRLDMVSKCLQDSFESCSQILLVIDALDEISHNHRDNLLRTVARLQKNSQGTVKFFATARSQVAPHFMERFPLCNQSQLIAADNDVLEYIEDRLSFSAIPVSDGLGLFHEKVKEEVLKACNGMFLLASKHMDRLLSQPTVGALLDDLANISSSKSGLDGFYEEAIGRIQSLTEGYMKLAKKTLSLVLTAKRPLSPKELQYAVATTTSGETRKEDITTAETLISYCSGFIELDKTNAVVRIAHYTAQEYLNRTNFLSDANSEMAIICVACLLYTPLEETIVRGHKKYSPSLSDMPFYRYAASHWGDHSREASYLDPVLFKKFLADGKRLFLTYKGRGLYNGLGDWGLTPLHIVATFGIVKALEFIEPKDIDLGARDFGRRTPISTAAEYGHAEMIATLLRINPKKHDQDMSPSTGLKFKTIANQFLTKSIVLANMVPQCISDWNSNTPLMYAVQNGHEAAAKSLLKSGVFINEKDIENRTALSYAARLGNEAIVKLLVSYGANINVCSSYFSSALLAATENGHEEVAIFLVENGAKIKKSQYGESELRIAARLGLDRLVKLLFETGAHPDTETESYGPPIIVAKYSTTVALLLKHGAQKDLGKALAIHAAMLDVSVARILLQRGASVDSGDCGKTALELAAKGRNKPIVEYLIEQGANLNIGFPVAAAVEGGSVPVCQLLLAKGADADKVNLRSETPLLRAVCNGDLAMAELIIAHTPDFDNYGNGEILRTAIRGGNVSIISLLLEKGAEVNRPDDDHPLVIAAITGVLAIFELLLDMGAKIDVQNARLAAATTCGQNLEIVKILIENGNQAVPTDNWDPAGFWKGFDVRFEQRGGDIENQLAIARFLLCWAYERNLPIPSKALPYEKEIKVALQMQSTDLTKLILDHGVAAGNLKVIPETYFFTGVFWPKHLQVLLEYGMPITLSDQRGEMSLLEWAVVRGRLRDVKECLAYGAQTSLKPEELIARARTHEVKAALCNHYYPTTAE